MTLDAGDAQLGRFTADASGFVTIRFIVPELDPGNYTLKLSGKTSDRSLSGSFEVVAANKEIVASPTTPQSSSVGWWVVPIGLVALVSIALLAYRLFRGRSRRE